MTDVTKTIISRIQQRRGLKQDLPSLRPGEFGFATDTNQLYIGADYSEYFNDYNKISRLENVAGAALSLNTITNHKLIRFTVPFHEFTVSAPSDTFSWYLGDVFTTANALNQYTNTAFTASTIDVFKNGDRQTGDTTEPYATGVNVNKDFKFNGNLSLSNHHIKFRSSLTVGDTVTVSYYNNTAVIDALTQPGYITLPTVSTKQGFYNSKNIPPSLYLEPELITVSETTGRGFIGVEDKHLLPFTFAQPQANSNLINLGNLFVQSSTIPGVNATIFLGNVDTLANLVSVFNAANTFLKMEKGLADTLYITLKENYYTQANTSFVLQAENSAANSVLHISLNTVFTPENDSVKAQLETWIQECIDDSNLNIFSSAVVGQAMSPTSGIATDTNFYQVSTSANPAELPPHDSKEEAVAFNQVINGIYILQDQATHRSGLVNIKTNIEIPTELTARESFAGTSFSSPFESVINGPGTVPGFALPTSPYNTYIVEYTMTISTGSPVSNYQRVGTMLLSGRRDMNGVAFTDTSTELNQIGGYMTLSASLDVNDNIVLTADTTLPAMTFRYIYRRWNSL